MNNNKQQTAVEWLKKELETYGSSFQLQLSWELLDELINQAKELEKQQIIDTFVEGMRCQNFDPNKGRAEIYYNETFNK